jgi:hypothetical protein
MTSSPGNVYQGSNSLLDITALNTTIAALSRASSAGTAWTRLDNHFH